MNIKNQKENLSGKMRHLEDLVQSKFTQQEEINKEQWALVTSKAGRVASPDKIAVECASPNGFQLLQNLREEGEIDDDEEVEEVNSETTGNVDETDAVTEVNGDQNGGKSLTDTSLSLDLATTETEAERNVAGVTRRQHSSHRGRGKGAKRPIVSSRGLVQAVAQQQKVQNPSKKASSRKQ